ncbi:MAG: hypothetical protein HN584_00335 [Akkermansiaceae bacterium]|nr:hypothetical protein [Akkermansiaceae bacterium]
MTTQFETLGNNDTAIGEQLTILGQNDTAIARQIDALGQGDYSERQSNDCTA